MRLPRSKVYRAFPELDRFSDEECRRYVHYVSMRSGWWIWIVAFLTGFVGMVVLTIATGMLASAAASQLVSSVRDSEVTYWIVFGFSMMGAAFGVAGGFFARDAMLRRAIRRRLHRAVCPSCNYSLLGLRTRDGRVNCPECGFAIELARIELTEQDLVAERA